MDRLPAELSSKRLRTMWNDPSFADVEVTCGDRSWAAHRSVLGAASPVFKRMLMSDFREAQKKQIDIKEAQPESVGEMLCFIYTGRFSRALTLRAPPRLKICRLDNMARIGTFLLLEGDVGNGLPVWQKEEDRTMFLCSSSGSGAQWQVTDCPSARKIIGATFSGEPHCGKLPHHAHPDACVAIDWHEGDKCLLTSILTLASQYDIKDLVYVCTRTMIDNSLINKDTIAAVARALRDAGLEDEAQDLLSELHSTVLSDKELFLALVRNL